MSLDLNTLTPAQKSAATTTSSRVGVIATAGAGKTRTIIFRIWYLTVYLKAKLDSVLALSFTNRGVDKLKDDLVKNGLSSFLEVLNVLTIDKLAKCIAEDYLGRTISQADFGSEEDMFKEVLETATHALENDLAIMSKYQKMYPNILIDEFQDVNDAQFIFIQKLLSPSSTLFVVGDDDQNVFDWRGANAYYMTNFITYFPTGEIHVLNECFRCSGHIVTVMNSLICNNSSRYPKVIKTSNEPGDPVTYRHFDSFDKELRYILREIDYLIDWDGYDQSDILLLYRTNEMVTAARRLLTEKGFSDVTVSTMHSAKGSENKIVFVASVNERYYPSTSPIESIEAERRVLFVGISRASTKLYISSSAVSIDEGKVKLSRPSRFISEIASCCQMPLKRLSSLTELSQGDNYYDLTGEIFTFLYHYKDNYYFGDRTAHLVAMDAAQILATLYVTY